ncbi:glycosyltransferase family 4 protein [Natrinema sp. H-ect4]|uniref:glycosyltransferase family 4 protein n=1 Tax=Natrinema sp. H-ect4 TaxID=3242699 RepID=UPI0035A8C0A4
MTDVLYITVGDRTWASTRYRALYLIPELQKRGINCTVHQRISWNILGPVGRRFGSLRNIVKARGYDIVVLQKILPGSKELDVLLSSNSNVIYDFDDAIYTNPPWDSTRDEERRQSVIRVLERIPYVIAGNPVLADYASNYCSNVFVAPTAIPEEPYLQYRNNENDTKSVVIGWIGNEENIWYLNQIEDAIREVLSSYESAELHVITSNDRPTTPLEERIGNDVQYIEWSEESELDDLSRFDIGIRPLIHDEWSRAKGGFTSVVQCMAMGMPVVVTPVGMLTDIVTHGECGYHADSHDEWILYLSKLIESPNQISSMGDKALERVEKERFWTHQRSEDLVKIFDSIH